MKELILPVDNKVLYKDAENNLANDYIDIGEDFTSSITMYNDSIRRTIISLASEGNYDGARRELVFYQQSQARVPGFLQRSEHYFYHVKELLDAIQNLKEFPNFENLRAAQQKQIRERVRLYAADLSAVLGRIDKIANDLKIQDVRSTMWTVRAFSICIMVLFMVIALNEAIQLAPTPQGIFLLIEDRLFSLVGF